MSIVPHNKEPTKDIAGCKSIMGQAYFALVLQMGPAIRALLFTIAIIYRVEHGRFGEANSPVKQVQQI